MSNSQKRQADYVNKRMKDPDMQLLKKGGFFGDGHKKMSDKQIKGYLRQELHGTRGDHPNSYICNSTIHQAQQQTNFKPKP